MAREIKFRAWFNGRNIMGYVTNLKGSNTDFQFDGLVAECFIDGRQVFYEVYKNFVLMQFTGLKDKNGVEIYEGDVVNAPSGFKGVIEFGLGKFGVNWDYGTQEQSMFGAWGQEDNLRSLDDGYYRDIEVIGNIYQNPELLKH